MEFILYVSVAILIVWILNRWHYRASVKLANKAACNKLHTFFGFGKLVRPKDILEYTDWYIKKHGLNCVVWLGPIPIFLTTDPQTIKDIFNSKSCIDKPSMFYGGIAEGIGRGIITEVEPTWSRHRKLLNKAFSHKVLISLLPVFVKNINSINEQISKSIEKGGMVDMLTMFRVLTFQNASQTVLKRNLDLTEMDPTVMANNTQIILDYGAEICITLAMKLNFVRKVADIFVFHTARKYLRQLLELIDESVDISQRKGAADPSYLPEVNSVLDFVLSDTEQNFIKINEIQGEMAHLLFGAFETTSTTLYLIVLLLAMHPEHQERVYEEIISIVPADDNEMTAEHLNQLVFMEMVINETMRLFPVVPIVGRTVSNENVPLSNDLTLPVGQVICINIHSLHRNKDIWGPDANVFNPDNFLPTNVDKRHPFAFIPFTKGQRFCIGWRYAYLFAKISLAKILRSFKFSTDFKYEDLKVENHLTLKLVTEPPLYLERRS